MLCDARQATVKPQWHATISAHCSPFWGQLGVSQLLLLFLAGLTPLFSHLLTIGWSRLVLSGATEVTWFCSTCLSSFGRLAPACSHGNARWKRVRGITQAPWGKAGNWHIVISIGQTKSPDQIQSQEVGNILFIYGRNCKIRWQRELI